MFFESKRSVNPSSSQPSMEASQTPGTSERKSLEALRRKSPAPGLRDDDDLPASLELPAPYLLGWNISSPEDSSKLSQKETAEQQSRFKLEYDIYSFGLVLLEIGLWKPLIFLRNRCSSDDEFFRKIKREYCDQLLSAISEIYRRATKRRLNNNFDPKDTNSLPASTDNEDRRKTINRF
ncbi:hypothetical protein HD806DRAFT_536774 [Xylariaceae sp. AK1471]|nr:hypothetical protein HD806DRAFT_536774 [Xylariaceae sp. AK1471]